MTFNPVDHKVELQVSQGINQKCRCLNGKHASFRYRVTASPPGRRTCSSSPSDCCFLIIKR